ncbi:MAG: hydroxymethylbilane synthase [Bacteroidota bacterium]
MKSPIRIGTRDSELALWQARNVQKRLEDLNLSTVLVPVKSAGDLDLETPLYELGVTGIFTKALDIALLNKDIDVAVHSMKDVPTLLPKGILPTAVMERASTADVLLHKGLGFLGGKEGIVATGSLRRRAQWLHRYPNHEVVGLRGNVNTRLLKLIESSWNGAVFAQAGLERIKLLPEEALPLDWMIPAPAQGAMLVATLEKNEAVVEATRALNHQESAISVQIERDFLRTLEGGCTAPIGALAIIKDKEIHFKGCLLSLDGKQRVEVNKTCPLDNPERFGETCALEVLESGGQNLRDTIRNDINSIH